MRKLLAIILTLCSLCALTLTSAETAVLTEEMAKLVGTWEAVMDGRPAGTIRLNADGTWENLTDPDYIITGEWWAREGYFSDGEDTCIYSLEDGVLTIMSSYGDMTLRRAQADTLVGSWQVEGEALDMILDATAQSTGIDRDMLAANFSLIYTLNADGTYVITATVFDTPGVQEGTYTFTETDVSMDGNESEPYRFEDGKLIVTSGDIEMVMHRVEE